MSTTYIYVVIFLVALASSAIQIVSFLRTERRMRRFEQQCFQRNCDRRWDGIDRLNGETK